MAKCSIASSLNEHRSPEPSVALKEGVRRGFSRYRLPDFLYCNLHVVRENMYLRIFGFGLLAELYVNSGYELIYIPGRLMHDLVKQVNYGIDSLGLVGFQLHGISARWKGAFSSNM